MELLYRALPLSVQELSCASHLRSVTADCTVEPSVSASSVFGTYWGDEKYVIFSSLPGGMSSECRVELSRAVRLAGLSRAGLWAGFITARQ